MLENLKLLLGFDTDDTTKDKMLLLLVSMATARLKLLLGGIDPPESLDHIICDVTICRFNRIGSEGLTSHSVEGESLTFTDDDFKGYANEIQAFLEAQENSTRGKVRFM